MMAFASARRHSLLLGKPGSGKTMAAIHVAMDDVIEHGGPILVVAPPIPARIGWAREAGSWAATAFLSVRPILSPDLNFERVAGLLSVRNRAATRNRILGFPESVHTVPWHLFFNFVELMQGTGWPYRTVILDEATFLQSHKSKMFQAAKHLCKNQSGVERVQLLSGTLAPDDPEQLFAPTFLCDGGTLLGENITTFRSWWLLPAKVDKRTKQVYSYTVDPAQKAELERRMAQLAISVPTPIDCGVIVNDIFVDLPDDVRRSYREIKRQLITVLESGVPIDAPNAAAMTGKLLQFASGSVYDGDHDAQQVHGNKIEALAELLPHLGPTLVFYWFKHEKARLLEAFPHAVDVREPGAVEQFARGSVPLLIAQWQSAAHGIDTLQNSCSDVVVFTPPFGAGVYEQGLARIIRPGQKAATVTVHRIIAERTIDESILFDVLPGKKTLSESILKRTYDIPSNTT